jgi:hypothetical protein
MPRVPALLLPTTSDLSRDRVSPSDLTRKAQEILPFGRLGPGPWILGSPDRGPASL